MTGTHRATRTLRRRPLAGLGRITAIITLALLALAGVALAAFLALTGNTGNQISTATIGALTDDDGGQPMFTLTGLQPGDVRWQCLTVTKDLSGGGIGLVRLYGTATGTLGAHLGLIIDKVASGGYGTGCDHTNTHLEPIYTGTLAGLAATHSNYASGVDAKAINLTNIYRYRLEVLGTAGPGQTAGATFTYEAPGT